LGVLGFWFMVNQLRFMPLLVTALFVLSFSSQSQSTPPIDLDNLHFGQVRDVAWSPDGERIAAVTSKGIVLMDDALIIQATCDMKIVNARQITWSPDGDFVSIYARIFDANDAFWYHYAVDENGFTPVLAEYTATTYSAWQDDRLMLLNNDRLYIVVSPSNSVEFALESMVTQAQWHATGAYFAVQQNDRVTVYDANSYEGVLAVPGVNQFWWGNNPNRIAVRSSAAIDEDTYGVLTLYHIHTGEEITTITGNLLQNDVTEYPQPTVREYVRDVQLMDDACYLVIHHVHPLFPSDSVRTWDICSHDKPTTINENSVSLFRINLIALSIGEHYVFTIICCGSWAIPVGIAHSIRSGESLELDGHRWHVSPDNTLIAVSGVEHGGADIHNANTLEHLYTIESLGNMILSVAWHPDGDRLLIGRVDSIEVVDVESGEMLAENYRFFASGYGLNYTAIDSNTIWDDTQQYFAVVSSGAIGRAYSCASVRVWDSDINLVAVYQGYVSIDISIAWEPDVPHLRIQNAGSPLGFGCTRDAVAEIWDVETNTLLATEPYG
jgi:WD40 repeat protein